MLVLVNKLSYGNAVHVMVFGQPKQNEGEWFRPLLFQFFFSKFLENFLKNLENFWIGESYSSFEFKIIKPNGLSSS